MTSHQKMQVWQPQSLHKQSTMKEQDRKLGENTTEGIRDDETQTRVFREKTSSSQQWQATLFEPTLLQKTTKKC